MSVYYTELSVKSVVDKFPAIWYTSKVKFVRVKEVKKRQVSYDKEDRDSRHESGQLYSPGSNAAGRGIFK